MSRRSTRPTSLGPRPARIRAAERADANLVNGKPLMRALVPHPGKSDGDPILAELCAARARARCAALVHDQKLTEPPARTQPASTGGVAAYAGARLLTSSCSVHLLQLLVVAALFVVLFLALGP